MDDYLTSSGIRMVMHAGDARVKIRRCLDAANGWEFQHAKELLKEADGDLLEGHKVQTEILQKECKGEPQGYNVLFSHGMDTLMTVNSEYELAEKLITMMEALDSRLKKAGV